MKPQVCIKRLLAVASLGFASVGAAGNCTVPGTHPTIQAAIDDPGCATIDLLPQTYFEHLEIDRSLTLAGPPGNGAMVQGQVNLTGISTVVALSDFSIVSGCESGTLRVVGGSEMTGSGLSVLFSSSEPCAPGLLYLDGFEN